MPIAALYAPESGPVLRLTLEKSSRDLTASFSSRPDCEQLISLRWSRLHDFRVRRIKIRAYLKRRRLLVLPIETLEQSKSETKWSERLFHILASAID